MRSGFHCRVSCASRARRDGNIPRPVLVYPRRFGRAATGLAGAGGGGAEASGDGDPDDGADAHDVDDPSGLPGPDDNLDPVAGDGRSDAGDPVTEEAGGVVIECGAEVGSWRGHGGKTRPAGDVMPGENHSFRPDDPFPERADGGGALGRRSVPGGRDGRVEVSEAGCNLGNGRKKH